MADEYERRLNIALQQLAIANRLQHGLLLKNLVRTVIAGMIRDFPDDVTTRKALINGFLDAVQVLGSSLAREDREFFAEQIYAVADFLIDPRTDRNVGE